MNFLNDVLSKLELIAAVFIVIIVKVKAVYNMHSRTQYQIVRKRKSMTGCHSLGIYPWLTMCFSSL